MVHLAAAVVEVNVCQLFRQVCVPVPNEAGGGRAAAGWPGGAHYPAAPVSSAAQHGTARTRNKCALRSMIFSPEEKQK